MKVEYRVTLESMRRNRRRTRITIFGVVLCIAMLSAIATMMTSFRSAIACDYTFDHGTAI